MKKKCMLTINRGVKIFIRNDIKEIYSKNPNNKPTHIHEKWCYWLISLDNEIFIA